MGTTIKRGAGSKAAPIRTVRVGFDAQVFGTIAATPHGLHFTGDVSQLQAMARKLQGPLTDDAFLETLPRRMKGRMWAVAVTPDATTEEPREGASGDGATSVLGEGSAYRLGAAAAVATIGGREPGERHA